MKINLKNVKEALSRDEMKAVSGGCFGRDVTCIVCHPTCVANSNTHHDGYVNSQTNLVTCVVSCGRLN